MVKMRSYLENLFLHILSHRYKSLLLVVLLVAYPLAHMGRLQFSLDYRDFFGGGDPHVSEFFEQQDTYQISDNILIALEPTDERYVFDMEFLRKVKEYTAEAWTLPYVTRVDSITNFQNSFASGDDNVVVQDLVPEVEPSLSIDQVRKIATTEPALLNRIVSKNGKFTAINLTISVPPDRPAEAIAELVPKVRDMAKRLRNENEIENVYMSGTVMINNAFYEVSINDMKTLIPAMFLVIAIVLIMQLQSWHSGAVILLVVGIAVGVTFGFSSLIGVKITPPVATVAPIVMMLSIAACVHIVSGYSKYLSASFTKEEAMLRSISNSFVPIALTSITTVIGFLSLNLAESPPFRDLGNLVAIGVIVAFLLTYLLLPVLLTLAPIGKRSGLSLIDRMLAYLCSIIVRKTWTTISVCIAVMVVCVFGLGKNELNDEFLKYFDTSIEFRKDNDFISKNLTGVYQIEYSISSGTASGISDPNYLELLDEFSQWFQSQPDVIHVQTISDVYKKANMTLSGGAAEHYMIPSSQSLAAQALLAYEMSLPFGLDLNNQLSVDKSASKFVVTIKTVSAKRMIELEDLAAAWLKSNAPEHAQALGTGPALLFAHIGQRSIYSGLIGGAAALLLICLITSVVFGSMKIGLISLIPNLFPAAMAFGLWGTFYGKINMALAMVISMTLGIIVDDTIHFLYRFRSSIAAGESPEESLRTTFHTVGPAIVTTSLVLISGFMVLTLSPFAMNWGMGLLSSITIACALFTDLLLLPAILLIAYGKYNEKAIPITAHIS